MKRTFALLLAGLLMLSMTACTSGEPSESSSPPEENSSVSSQQEEGSSSSLEVVDEEKEDAEGEDVSNLDTSSEASTPETSSAVSQPPAEVTPPAEQQPVERKPKPKPEKETPVTPPVKVEQEPELEAEPEPEPVQQQTPPAQTQQPPTPVASAQDDGEWTQEMVDDVVEAYRTAALERGWTEDTDLNVALTTGGAWGNPWNTQHTDFNVLTKPENIEEYLYGYEFDVGHTPDEMYFNLCVEDEGDHWVIYFIFSSDM